MLEVVFSHSALGFVLVACFAIGYGIVYLQKRKGGPKKSHAYWYVLTYLSGLVAVALDFNQRFYPIFVICLLTTLCHSLIEAISLSRKPMSATSAALISTLLIHLFIYASLLLGQVNFASMMTLTLITLMIGHAFLPIFIVIISFFAILPLYLCYRYNRGIIGKKKWWEWMR